MSETGTPIIKAHLNPLVMWIWVGVLIMIGGTMLASDPERAAGASDRSSADPDRSGGSGRLIWAISD